MNNIFAAIMTKCSGSALSASVGGRVFESEAPADTEYPYIVFSIISGIPEDNFTDSIDSLIVQFSIYSISKGLSELNEIFENMKSLFDYGILGISGYSHIGFIRQNMSTMTDYETTKDGTELIRHWAIEYLIRTEK